MFARSPAFVYARSRRRRSKIYSLFIIYTSRASSVFILWNGCVPLAGPSFSRFSFRYENARKYPPFCRLNINVRAVMKTKCYRYMATTTCPLSRGLIGAVICVSLCLMRRLSTRHRIAWYGDAHEREVLLSGARQRYVIYGVGES